MTPEHDRIPVTVLSGYLGAGKTTLVNHVLTNQKGYEVGVIVNDMGEVNVDADLIARENEDEGIVDLSNGCICCRLQDDLLSSARRLADARDFDYLLVESSGISEPIPVAKVFLEGTEESDFDPSELFRLDTMVTVLDTYGFWKEFDAGTDLTTDATSGNDRPMGEVLVEGIEFCDVLLLNKCDMVPDDVLDEIDTIVAELQPRAERMRTTYSEVDPGLILDTGRFDFEAAKREQGWKRRLAGGGTDHDHDATSAADRHGVSSFVYRADRPFHPDRLAVQLRDWNDSIVRAKGVCYVAGREEVIGVSQAGPAVQAGPIGTWESEDERQSQLVFIGREVDEVAIRDQFDDCLLGSEETIDDATDPFPIES